jgi:predicted anti-sigma-YlaC factor YlaD
MYCVSFSAFATLITNRTSDNEKALSPQSQAAGCTCQQVAKQATAFLENRLSSAVNVDIWRHLEACADCRTYLSQLALVRDSLRKLPVPAMPDDMREKLLARLRKMRDSGGS